MSQICTLLKILNVDSCGKTSACSKHWVKWANLGIFCWQVWKNVNFPPISDDGFKKYENKCKFLLSETLISHSILVLEQVENIATGT